MLIAQTVNETIHGNPGDKRRLPADILVMVTPATNLPKSSPIKFWAMPLPGETNTWPAETLAWANDVGVGLHESDIMLGKISE